MTLAENLDSGLDFDQAFFRRGQNYPAGEEEASEGLFVTAAQSSTGRKSLGFGLRTLHKLILMDSQVRHIEGTRVMPIFEYVCEQCDHEFEALVYGSEKAECPKCHGKKLAAQLSAFAVAAKGSASSAAANPVGGCGTCGDPRGPGACSLPDPD